jgi:ribonuclease P protein component
MLSKGRRIARHLFPTDLRQGQVVHAPHLSLRVIRGTAKTALVSVVVSKKIAKRAVDRHLVKRRVYESVALCEKTRLLPPGGYVFFAKKDAHTIPFKEMHTEVMTLLKNMNASIVKRSKLV